MKRKKTGLCLVTDNIDKKAYEVVTLYMVDEGAYSFALNVWEMWESPEWVEFRKMDKSVLECFPVTNITRISFITHGGEPITVKPTLKPVA